MSSSHRADVSLTETFCMIPWVALATKNTGVYRVCVPAAYDEATKGILRNSDGEALKIGHASESEIRNAVLMKDVRAKMLAGESHTMCKRCDEDERCGIKSKRQWANEQWRSEKEDCINNTSPDGAIQNTSLKALDIRFSNLCTLRCRSCWPGESSAWLPLWKKMGRKSITIDGNRMSLDDAGKKFQWAADVDLDTQIDYSNVDFVHFSGGEPLLHRQHIQMLEYLINSNVAHKITLDYNSSLQILQDVLVEDYWKKFKRVKIGVSIDGFGSLNNWIRIGSCWTTILRNIDRIKKLPNVDIWVTCTIMTYNVFFLDKIIDFSNTISNVENETIVFHFLRSPEHVSIRALPPHLLSKLQTHCRLLKDSYPVYQAVERFINVDQDHEAVIRKWNEHIAFTNAINSFEIKEQIALEVEDRDLYEIYGI